MMNIEQHNINNMEFTTAPNILKRDRDESDLQYHGFIATKIRKRDATIVTRSCDGNISIGAKVLTLNGIYADNMLPNELADMFSSRNQKIVPMIIQEHVSDLAFHGFEATKLNSDARTFISSSTIDYLNIGSEVFSLQGIETSSFSPASLKRFFMRRDVRLVPEMVRYYVIHYS